MTPLDWASLLKDYGPWGLCALLMAAIVYLHKGWQSCQDARVADGKLATEALTRTASSNAEIASMMHALREGQVEIMRVVSLNQRDDENGDRRTQERIEALTAATVEVGRRLDQVCRGAPR